MEQTPLNKKIIKIKSTEIVKGDGWTKIKIISNEGGRDIKYDFFTKKKSDGLPTKAFEFFSAHKQDWDTKIMLDQDVQVEIGYEERPFISKRDGKQYNSRSIKFFKEVVIGQPIGDQNQAEYRIPDITPEGIPIIEPKKPTKKVEFEDDGVNLPFKAPDIDFPETELGDEYTD
jgi:hypothetical protein